MATMKVGMFGFGTVGGGVVQLLKDNKHLQFKAICMRDLSKQRDVAIPEGCKVTKDWKDIVEDPEIQMVIEVMGGVTLAKEVVFESIRRGKHVITANKPLISKYVDEIEALLKQHPSVCFMYEASVCGGIPIINTFQRGLACDEIHKIVGIMNGTTNYILSKMEKEGLTYQSVLKDAMEKGYAEADPSADVEGWDARSKLCILTKLGFGVTIEEEKLFCQGISRITATDFQYAKMIGHNIKLLGISEKIQKADGGSFVNIFLSPVLVPSSNPIANIDGVTNVVQVNSKNLNSSWFIGPGAGRYPTANSIVADVLDVMRLTQNGTTNGPAPIAFPGQRVLSTFESEFEAQFYIRFVVLDKVGVIHRISGAMTEFGISLFSILQVPIVDANNVPFAIVTDKCKLSQIRTFCAKLSSGDSGMDFLKETPFFMPYFVQ